jgi:hypothetical protein
VCVRRDATRPVKGKKAEKIKLAYLLRFCSSNAWQVFIVKIPKVYMRKSGLFF